MKLLLYFLAGFLTDALATVDMIAVQKKRALLSAAMTSILIIISYWVLAEIILSPDRLLELFIYALGGGVGAYFTIKYQPKG